MANPKNHQKNSFSEQTIGQKQKHRSARRRDDDGRQRTSGGAFFVDDERTHLSASLPRAPLCMCASSAAASISERPLAPLRL